jgi:hypothetical protein
MANIVETVSYDAGVYLIATSDAVVGGTSGIANKAATNLANRTAYLKGQVDTINALTPTLAPLLSPTLTGTPKTAAPSVGDNTVQIATTAFVQITSKGRIAINVAGSANVTLSAVQAGYAFIEFTGALTGNITITVPGSASSWIMRNSTSGSYSITLKSATAGGTTMDLPQTGSQKVLTDGTNVYGLGYLPLTGGMISPSGSTSTASGWAALNTPTLRVADAYSGTGGGLSIESYQPTIQLIDQTANAKNMRLLMDNGVLKIANDPGDNSGVWNTSGFALNADGYMTVGGGVTSPSNNVVYYANGVSLSTSTTAYGFFHAQEFNETTTGGGYSFTAAPKVKASAFTMGNLIGFYANVPTIGAGATVTSYTGFYVQDFSGAGSNYGLRMRMSSGTGKWNIYADGTASNYLAGTLLIGTTTDNGTDKLQVVGTVKSSGSITTGGAFNVDGAAGVGRSVYFKTSGSNRWELTASSSAESGSNAGSNLVLNRYSDAGTWIDSPLSITRSTGIASFGVSPTAPTPTAGDSSATLATTAFVVNTKNGASTVSVAGSTDRTLTAAQAGVGIIILTGALTGSITVFVPAGTGQYIFSNRTTGSYTLNLGVSGAGGTTAIVPQGQSVVAYSDGTNIVLAGAAASSSFTRYSFTATAGQSSFPAIYTVGNVLAMVNGAVQAAADITATDSATVQLTGYNGGAGCLGGEDVTIIAFTSFTVANAMTPAGGTFSGPIMLAGSDTGVTPAQFDNSTKLATTRFVKANAGQVAGVNGISGTTTLTAANAGLYNSCFGTPGTISLPVANTCPIGSLFYFHAVTSFTIATQGTDKILTNSTNTTLTSLSMLDGDTLILECDGAGTFKTLAGSVPLKYSAQFGASLASSGYQKLPSGLIIQWGTAVTSGSGTVTATLPIAFPNANLRTVGMYQSGSLSVVIVNVGTTGTTYSNFWACNGSGAAVSGVTISYIAIGY